jgi:restriction system protein
MDSVEAQDELQGQVNSLDSEQFERFCKIIVETVENPRSIELTPFGGDGGIDIRGAYGQSFFNSKFGVQVKQYTDTNTVGSPSLRDFIGALSQHNYQFGCFITSSSFVKKAPEIADEHSIVLIDGDTLLDTMLVNEVGVMYDGFDYDLDPQFWEIFEQTKGTDLVRSEEVPQADSLETIELCLSAIEEGNRFKPEIRGYMTEHTDRDNWTPRQADYYPLAAYALNFVHKDKMGEYDDREMRMWSLTRDGQEYVQLLRTNDEDERREYLVEQLRNSPIIERILPVIKDEGAITHSELKSLIAEKSELNPTTAGRRAGTVGKWLDELPEVEQVQDGQSYRYDFISKRLGDYVVDDS